ncbi:MAG: DUF222 domain-containing protein [Egibacteraceae bacterium]
MWAARQIVARRAARCARLSNTRSRALHLSRTFNGLGELRATLDPFTFSRLQALLDAHDQPDPPDTPLAQRRTPAQRRHDAFDRMLRAAEEHPDTTVHGAKPHLLITLDLLTLLTLLGRHDLASREPHLADHTPIDLARILNLLADAKLTTVLTLRR